MPIDDGSILAALRGDRSVADVCAAAGATEAEFTAARDGWLTRAGAVRDRSVHAAVTGRVACFWALSTSSAASSAWS